MRAGTLVLACCACACHAFTPSSKGAPLLRGQPIQGTMRSVPVMADEVPDMSDVGLDMLNDAMEAATAEDPNAPTNFDVKQMPGITAPLGFFDPAGITFGETEGRIRFLREAELKHGRVGMLAALGFLVAENFHPLFGGNIDVPSYVAFQQTPLQTFWYVVTFAVAIPEVYSVFSFNTPFGGQPWSIRSDHEPGNLGFDPLGLKPKDPAELVAMQNKELNNGRLAMLAAAGMIAQELVSGEKILG